MAAHDDTVQSKLACVVMLRGSDEATTVSGDGFKYYMLSLNANSEANFGVGAFLLAACEYERYLRRN